MNRKPWNPGQSNDKAKKITVTHTTSATILSDTPIAGKPNIRLFSMIYIPTAVILTFIGGQWFKKDSYFTTVSGLTTKTVYTDQLRPVPNEANQFITTDGDTLVMVDLISELWNPGKENTVLTDPNKLYFYYYDLDNLKEGDEFQGVTYHGGNPLFKKGWAIGINGKLLVKGDHNVKAYALRKENYGSGKFVGLSGDAVDYKLRYYVIDKEKEGGKGIVSGGIKRIISALTSLNKYITE